MEPKRILTVPEVAAYLRVHPSTIYRVLRQGTIPAFKLGSEWRFNIESIDRWRVERERRSLAKPKKGPAGPRQAPSNAT
jgi:excisionase family DNA binding protein